MTPDYGWSDLVEPVTATLRWRGAEHEVEWRAGELILRAHDVAADLALTALGGGRCVCLDVHRLWQGGADMWPVLRTTMVSSPAAATPTDELLALRRRHAERIAAVNSGQVYAPSLPGAHRGGTLVTTGLSPQSGLIRHRDLQLREDLRRAYDAALLRTIGPDLTLRLALTAIVEQSRTDARRSTTSLLDRSLLRTYAAPALARAANEQPARVSWHVVDAGGQPHVQLTSEAGRPTEAVIGLPLRWLVDVWAAGISVVDGWFTLTVSQRRSVASVASVSELDVLAVRIDRGTLDPGDADRLIASTQPRRLRRTHGGPWSSEPLVD